MLEATHTQARAWTLVDFNDQRRGRLTLIRHLLDRMPDARCRRSRSSSRRWRPRAASERFEGPLKPIADAS